MAKYLVEWEVERSQMAGGPAEIAKAWKAFTELVRKDLASGVCRDWGSFPGEAAGYTVLEGSETDVMKLTMQYVPFFKFKVHPVSDIDTVVEFLASAS